MARSRILLEEKHLRQVRTLRQLLHVPSAQNFELVFLPASSQDPFITIAQSERPFLLDRTNLFAEFELPRQPASQPASQPACLPATERASERASLEDSPTHSIPSCRVLDRLSIVLRAAELLLKAAALALVLVIPLQPVHLSHRLSIHPSIHQLIHSFIYLLATRRFLLLAAYSCWCCIRCCCHGCCRRLWETPLSANAYLLYTSWERERKRNSGCPPAGENSRGPVGGYLEQRHCANSLLYLNEAPT